MRIIFLDVDGVLNNDKTEDKIFGWVGIDPKLVDKLKKIYDTSNEEEETRIVVSSSWKRDEVRAIEDKKSGYVRNDNCYAILLERLNNAGMEVLGYTTETISLSERGEGILRWIEDYEKDHDPISAFVILDDEAFDFLDRGLEDHFVKTCLVEKNKDNITDYLYAFGSGILDKHVEKALKILRGEFEENAGES